MAAKNEIHRIQTNEIAWFACALLFFWYHSLLGWREHHSRRKCKKDPSAMNNWISLTAMKPRLCWLLYWVLVLEWRAVGNLYAANPWQVGILFVTIIRREPRIAASSWTGVIMWNKVGVTEHMDLGTGQQQRSATYGELGRFRRFGMLGYRDNRILASQGSKTVRSLIKLNFGGS